MYKINLVVILFIFLRLKVTCFKLEHKPFEKKDVQDVGVSESVPDITLSFTIHFPFNDTPNYKMSLILNLHTLIASQLVGDWLLVPDLCRLESAFSSVARRLHLLSIYERTTMACSDQDTKGYFEMQLEWMIARKIKVSSLCFELVLPSSTAMKITSLLFSSKLHLKYLSVTRNKSVMDTIIPCVGMYCRGLKCLELKRCNTNIRSLLVSAKCVSELRFYDCGLFVAEQFEDVICPSVTQLFLDGYIAQPAQQAIWNMCPNLTDYSRFNGVVHVSPHIRPLQTVTLVSS